MVLRKDFRGERVAAILLLCLPYWSQKAVATRSGSWRFPPSVAIYEVFAFVSSVLYFNVELNLSALPLQLQNLDILSRADSILPFLSCELIWRDA